MARHVIGKTSDLLPGQRQIVEVEGLSIGVFNVAGTFYALKNRCPHQAGPLCLGSLKGTALPSAPGEYIWGREGEILRCPWHGWEFDVTTGRSIWNPHRCRTATYEVSIEPDEEDPSVETYPVTVEGGRIVLHV